MALKLFNTLTRSKEEFKPIKDNTVSMYNCGPTVYGTPHIGNYRSFLFADILKRYLKFVGYKVTQVMNITDVGHMTSDADEGEDKLEVAAKKENLDPWKIAEKYTKIFMEDLDLLGIDKAEFYPRATETIKEMQDIIKVLLDKGFAYEVDGNVYYDVTKFKDYGKLSGNTLEKLKAQKRSIDDPNKKGAQDFVLWFANSKYTNHIMKWDSPWGEGYPGWHIECSAMSMKLLSSAFDGGKFNPDRFETIDIHTGGEDNKFPHHESEIAQTEGVTGKKFSKFWLHVTFLKVEGEKMAKSVGNFYSIKDLMDKGYSPKQIRYELMATQYRQPMNYTFKGMDDAKIAINRIQETIFALQNVEAVESDFDSDSFIEEKKNAFKEQMDDDLNMSGALGVLFDVIKNTNKAVSALSVADADKLLIFLEEIDSVLNIMDFSKQGAVDGDIDELIKKRDVAREEKDWATSDKIRDELKSKGIE